MNPYLLLNAASVVGVGAIGAGVYLVAGLGWSLVSTGSLILGLAVYGARRLDS